MTNKTYKQIFNQKRKKEFQLLINEFNLFAKGYETKKEASEDYNEKILELDKSLKCSVISGRTVIDSFKHAIITKADITFNKRMKAPITFLIDVFYNDILKEFKITKEGELRRKETPSFDYLFFENFSKDNAIDFISKTIAFEDFKIFLNKIKFSENLNADKNVKPILLKYKNLDSVIEILYETFLELGYINIEKDEFSCHFKRNTENKYNKIRWNASSVELLYLFYKIKRVDKNYYDILINHFTDKLGKEFKKNNLYATFNKIKQVKAKEKSIYENEIKYDGKKKAYEKIEEILDKINKLL